MIRLPVIICAIATIPVAFATETDQFTTPDKRLHDIGPALSRKVVQIIEADRTGRDPERILSEWVGQSPFASRLSRWAQQTQPAATFRPSAFASIYRATFSPIPATFFLDSPTVNLYGHYLGTDKIDHVFRQGYAYFELADEAAAVRLGVSQEHKQLGTLSSGVYSNADLAANYAGMKFYRNLRQPIRIGNRDLPPLFEQTPDGWQLRGGVDPDRVLEPFISDHLDESLNPSRYRFSRSSIRASIRKRCDRWTAHYADRLHLIAPSGESFAKDWHGEDYGHWLPPGEEVSIATECLISPRDSLR